jgi:hypothetical protein
MDPTDTDTFVETQQKRIDELFHHRAALRARCDRLALENDELRAIVRDLSFRVPMRYKVEIRTWECPLCRRQSEDGAALVRGERHDETCPYARAMRVNGREEGSER